MLSLGGIKSFVFARQASVRGEFIARLTVLKQSFLFSWDSTWPPSDKGLLRATYTVRLLNSTTIVGIGNVEWRELCAIFCMTRAARALEIACDSRKQKLYRLNRPLLTTVRPLAHLSSGLFLRFFLGRGLFQSLSLCLSFSFHHAHAFQSHHIRVHPGIKGHVNQTPLKQRTVGENWRNTRDC